MKISASIYTPGREKLRESLEQLTKHPVDMVHVDCDDEPDIFSDIPLMREITGLPIDLHLITPDPLRYVDLIHEHRPDMLCFQLEDLPSGFTLPKVPGVAMGLALCTDTSWDTLVEHVDNLDFVLVMATTPGKSGGRFEAANFKKIRQIQRHFPQLKVHVDGGVNAEVGFILRNLGVWSAVSGSFLMKADNPSNALLELKAMDTGSSYQVSDFMAMGDELPIVNEEDLDLRTVLETIEHGKVGFCMVTDGQGKLTGLVSNADVRRGVIAQMDRLSRLDPTLWVNRNPVVAKADWSVSELLDFIKNTPRPIMYLPVTDANEKACGFLTFVNLIKGEL